MELEKKEVFIESSTWKHLLFLGIFVLVFQFFKSSPQALLVYKKLYFSVVSPAFTAVNKVLPIVYAVLISYWVIIIAYSLINLTLLEKLNSLVKGLCKVFIAFLILWGFNYADSDRH